ncbi:MAG TPA: hypothetical protein PL141_09385 [Thermoflexales bacterium]|nr:hypothetical protein [Thermoflexales bacterium]
MDEAQNKIARVLRRDDIRGKYPRDLNEDVARAIGRALPPLFGGQNPLVVVGWDARLSSPALAEALSRGLREAGAQVRSLGLASTEMVYFAAGFAPVDGGVMVTASHNPADENGFKIVRRGAQPVSGEELAAHLGGQSAPPNLFGPGLTVSSPSSETTNDYAETVIRLSGIRRKNAEKLKVVAEAGNGVGGLAFRQVAARLPFLDVVYSNETPDGRFPICLPNPLDPAYMKLAQGRVLADGAALGLAFDGDADRVGAVDSKGEVLSASEIMAVLALRALQAPGALPLPPPPPRALQAPGALRTKFMYNLVMSQLVPDVIGEMGGAAVMTPIGHGQIKARMRLPQHADCVLAGEHSGHFFFRDFFRADSGMIAALMLIEAELQARERGRDLSAEVAEWRERYAILPEKNFELPASHPGAAQDVIDAVRRHFAGRGAELKQYAPGDPIPKSILRMDFAEEWGKWWLCARPSGNEPLLRLNLEIVAKNNARGRMGQIAAEVIGLIEENIKHG